jgi:DNA-binding response OmpR family regulator
VTEKVRAVRILCLACASEVFSTLENALKHSRYSAITASTRDQAVGICVSQFVAAAIVDAKSIRDQEWSVVKTLKAVRASLPVILLEERDSNRKSPLPDGVDAVVSIASPRHLFDKLDELIKKAGIRAAGV